jgi:hypothetical protein
MSNLTIVVDEDVLRRARIRALERGTSVNRVLAEFLRAFAGEDPRAEALANFAELARRAGVERSHARTWRRDELYDRPVMQRG